jgi:excisionase family DNA binding protein
LALWWRDLLGERRTDMAVARNDELLTPAEVATLFRVDPKTVTRWANTGKLSPMKTLGGHRRFFTSEIRNLIGPSQPAATVEIGNTQPDVVDIREAVVLDIREALTVGDIPLTRR